MPVGKAFSVITLKEGPSPNTLTMPAGQAVGPRAYRQAQALTEREIPTKQGNARWRHQTVRSIVKRQNGRVEYAG